MPRFRAAQPSGLEPASTLPVEADRAQFQQVLMNLVANAGGSLCDGRGTIRFAPGARPLKQTPAKARSPETRRSPVLYVPRGSESGLQDGSCHPFADFRTVFHHEVPGARPGLGSRPRNRSQLWRQRRGGELARAREQVQGASAHRGESERFRSSPRRERISPIIDSQGGACWSLPMTKCATWWPAVD
jgi:hypothetical protein